jgi:hypothetical protein
MAIRIQSWCVHRCAMAGRQLHLVPFYAVRVRARARACGFRTHKSRMFVSRLFLLYCAKQNNHHKRPR